MARAVWRVIEWEHDFGTRIMSEHLFPATATGKKAADSFVKNYNHTGQFSVDTPKLFWFEKKNRNTVIHRVDKKD